MDFDLTPLVYLAIFGFICAVLLVVGFIIALIAWLLGYWELGIVINL